jgi:hypothetical protein
MWGIHEFSNKKYFVPLQIPTQAILQAIRIAEIDWYQAE